MSMVTKWSKVPSVSTGGKKHFYVAVLKGRYVSVVWDRSAMAWRMRYGINYELASGETFKNHRDCMRFADGLEHY